MLVGTGEIRKQHGLSRTQVFRLIHAGDWPKPKVTTDAGQKLWEKADVSRCVQKLFRTGRLAKQGDSVVLVPARYLNKTAA